MNEWTEVRVGELGKVLTGKTPKTSIDDYYGGDIPFITPSDNMNVKYIRKTNKTLTENGAASVKNNIIPAGAICVSCIGSDLGKVVISTTKSVTNQQINSIIVDESKFDVDFVYYSMVVLGKILNRNSKTSTAVPIVNKSQFSNYTIMCPSLSEQRKIAKVLSLLDTKIEKNDEIGVTLGEQLRIIFEEMFIKKALDDWETKKIGDYLELERGLSYKGKYLSEGDGVPMLNLGNILPNSVFRPEKLKYYTGEFKPRHVVKPGDIIVANTDLTQAREVLGSAIRVPDLGYDTVICSHHISIVKKCMISKNFILGLLNMPDYRKRVAGFATGTTVLALPTETILNCEFRCPPKTLLEEYDRIAEPIYKKAELLRIENVELSNVRNDMIVRLLSGEIDLSEVNI